MAQRFEKPFTQQEPIPETAIGGSEESYRATGVHAGWRGTSGAGIVVEGVH